MGRDQRADGPAPGADQAAAGVGRGTHGRRESECDSRSDAASGLGSHGAETYELLARYDAGLLKPQRVALGPMPAGATESMRAVAADIALLIGLRLAVDDDRPLIYSARFCAWRMGWTVLSGDWDKKRANRVINKLLAAGVIEWVGEMPKSNARLYTAPPLQPTVIRPGPQIPAISVEARVQPGGEVREQAVVDQAEAVLGDDLGVVAAGGGALARHHRPTPYASRESHRP